MDDFEIDFEKDEVIEKPVADKVAPIEWSPQQRQALGEIDNWLHTEGGPQTYYLAGYAGTGKSTLANYIGQMEQKRKGYAQYAALTGKAAVVLKRKGCANARTIHSLIYTSHDKSKEHLEELTKKLEAEPNNFDVREEIAAEKDNLKRPAWALKSPDQALNIWGENQWGTPYIISKISLFVIDECSMVDARLGDDLLSYGKKVLVLGDPAQLPPIAGQGFFTSKTPNLTLTEIHRQAAGNPIIDMATRVRNGQELALGQYGSSRVVYKTEMTQDEWLGADQILVGKNGTRNAFNRRIRLLLGFKGFLPEPGERLVCLRNNHDMGLLNGGLWKVIEVQDDPTGDTFNACLADTDDASREVRCQILKCHFMGVETPPFFDRKVENEFTFGYALTTHKAQGSQWNNVIYYDEWTWNGRKSHVYTGITRAAERVTVVRP